MISCILLAAGASRRFGSPKALASFEGVPVIRAVQERILASPVAELIIVLGADRNRIEPHLLEHRKIVRVYNYRYKFGQTVSFQCGLRRVSPSSLGAMILPVDVPFIRLDTLASLCRTFCRESPDILVPVFDGRRGHPPVVHRRLFPASEALKESQPLHDLVRSGRHVVDLSVDDPGVRLTFNTPAEWRSIRMICGALESP